MEEAFCFYAQYFWGCWTSYSLSRYPTRRKPSTVDVIKGYLAPSCHWIIIVKTFVKALGSIILRCTNVPLRSFHLITFLLKKSPGDRGAVTYANLTILKHTVTHLHMDKRSFILTSLFYSSVTETETCDDSCIWAALFGRALPTQTSLFSRSLGTVEVHLLQLVSPSPSS